MELGTHIRPIRRSEYALAAELLGEYADWLDLDFCYENIEQELAAFPGEFAPPTGCFLLAIVDDQAAGCVALRRWGRLSGGLCELKRLFVRPGFRGRHIGMRLTQAAIDEARRIGYERLRLDTLPAMRAAIGLYESLGFVEIEKYRTSPTDDARYFELAL